MSAYSGSLEPSANTYVGLLPIGRIAGKTSPAAILASRDAGAHLLHLHFEHCFDSLLDLDLVRFRMDFKAQRALGFPFIVALLGNERAA